MWQSTAAMARAIGDGLAAGGASVRLLPLDGNHRSDVATCVLDAGALVVGSPTLNNCMFPTVADCLTYLKGLRRKNLIGAAFGSHGWSGEGAKQVHAMLEEMDVDVSAEPLAVKYVPDADALTRCRRLGLDLAEKLRRHVAANP
jgi:flavorubredoxin